MWSILAFVVGAVLGFIGGFLVYRNNVKKLQAKEAELRDELTDVKNALEKLKD